MRRLSPAPRQRGMTLVEALVSLCIGALLIMAGTPYYAQYMANSRLREAGNALLGEVLYTQSEAVKRNTRIATVMTGNTVTVRDVTSNQDLRTRRLGDGISIDGSGTTLTFGSQGQPVPFGTAASVNISLNSFLCDNDTRCPGLRVDGGGGIRLCNNKNAC